MKMIYSVTEPLRKNHCRADRRVQRIASVGALQPEPHGLTWRGGTMRIRRRRSAGPRTTAVRGAGKGARRAPPRRAAPGTGCPKRAAMLAGPVLNGALDGRVGMMIPRQRRGAREAKAGPRKEDAIRTRKAAEKNGGAGRMSGMTFECSTYIGLSGQQGAVVRRHS